MPSTYTNDLRLELQANGENSSTWGTKLNAAIQQIEDAIAGMTSVAVTGGDTTLTTVNGGTDESRYAIVKITGTLVSNSNIIVPDVSKEYIIWNATSGSYTVTVKTSAGAGVVVGQGYRSHLMCDGTDVLAAVTELRDLSSVEISTSPTSTSNTAVVNGSTYTGQLVAWNADGSTVGLGVGTASDTATVGATTFGGRMRTSLASPAAVQDDDVLRTDYAVGWDGTDFAIGGYTQFKVNGTPGANDMPTEWGVYLSADGSQTPTNRLLVGAAGHITLEGVTSTGATGTGNFVFSAAPTFTSIADLGSVTTCDINGGTIDGVTIGGASAGAGSFTTLSTTGNITGTLNNPTTVFNNTLASGAAALIFQDSGVSAGGLITYGPSHATLANKTYIKDYRSGGTINIAPDGGSTVIGAFSSTGLAVTGTLSTTGNVTLGDATSDTVTVNGYMGVGGAVNSAIGVYVQSSALSGTAQRGIISTPIGTSSATSQIVGVQAGAGTAAASFTVTDIYQLRATNASKGAGSTITNQTGLAIDDLTSGTNNYGITSAVSSGSNKYNIYASGTANNYFAGDVQIGSATDLGAYPLQVTGDLTVAVLNATNASGGYLTFARSGVAKNLIGQYKSVSGGGITLDQDTLFIRSATGIALSYDATPRFVFDASGNVGIGTSSPSTRFHVANSAASCTSTFASTSGAVYQVWSASTGVNQLQFGGTAGAYFSIYDAQNTAERLRIDSSGNVGIGLTPSGSYKFEVSGAASWFGSAVSGDYTTGQSTLALPAGAKVRIQNTQATDNTFAGLEFAPTNTAAQGQVSYIGAISTASGVNGTMVFGRRTGAATYAESMRIDSSGNVGIGTSSPAYPLHIVNSSLLGMKIQTTTPTFSSPAMNITDGTVSACLTPVSSTFAVGTYSAHSLALYTNNTSRVVVDSSGNVGIGVTPSAWTYFSNIVQGRDYSIAGGNNAGQSLRLFCNIYYDGSYRYKNATYGGGYIDFTNGALSVTNFSGNLGAGLVPSTTTNLIQVDKDKSLALQGATPQTGTGISFPATQSASSDANTLDDYREGSYTGTLTGCTTSPTGTVYYTKIGNLVTLQMPDLTATSNTTACTVTGAPSAIYPSAARVAFMRVKDNGTFYTSVCQIETSGTITLYKDVTGASFTSSGTKGSTSMTLTYRI